MEAFQRAGEEILRRFRAVELDEALFPDVVVPVLEEARLHELVTLEDLADGVLDAARLPPAAVSDSFSDAGICVFHHPAFSIEVLTWLEASTMAHEHGFCGAFQVLAGGSLHTRYRFEVERRVSEKMQFGRLERAQVEHLRPGAIAPIHAGGRFVHRLFHLERPSLSLVVRTPVQGARPQRAFLEPGIAYDPFGRSEELLQRLKVLRVLQRLGHPGFAERLRRRVEHEDLYSALLCAVEFGPGLYARGAQEELLPVLRERFRELAPGVEEALEQRWRFDRITGLRRRVTAPDLRFFLAVLLNAADRRELLALVAGHGTDSAPEARALGWIEELGALRGLSALDREGLTHLDSWLRDGALPATAGRARLDPEVLRPGRVG